MIIGIIGLPQSGKTTVFNAITKSSAQTGIGKQNINRAIVKIPDKRLDNLSSIFKPKKTTPATVEYIDLGGMGKGSINKDNIDAEFLSLLRQVDTILMVVRDFEDENIMHPSGKINASNDTDSLYSELVLSDLIVIEKRLERIKKDLKKLPNNNLQKEKELLLKFKDSLENNQPIRKIKLNEEEMKIVRGFCFLTQKPLMILVNVSEQKIGQEKEVLSCFPKYSDMVATKLIALSAKIESEIALLSEADSLEFMKDLGIKESAMDKLLKESYDLCGLISFFTAGEDECKAWTIKKGTLAPEAAGTIHTDLEKGFIRAETISYNDFMEYKNLVKAKQAGKITLEGKDYIVKDGDILNIKFNV